MPGLAAPLPTSAPATHPLLYPPDTRGRSVSKIASLFQSMTHSNPQEKFSQHSNPELIINSSRSHSVDSHSESLNGIMNSSLPQDNRSQFNSAKALFQNLERKAPLLNPIATRGPPPSRRSGSVSPNRYTDGGPRMESPPTTPMSAREPRSSPHSDTPISTTATTTVNPSSATKTLFASLTSPSPFRLNSTGTPGPVTPSPRAPPPLPPKPSKLLLEKPASTTAPHVPAPHIQENNIMNSTDSSIERQPREDSPLTEMTKRFNELVTDLEQMTSHNRTPAPYSAPTTTTASAATTSNSTSSISRYPRLTQTLNMEKRNPTGGAVNGDGNGLSKPSSLYEPYWRQHSWYTRRYGSGESLPGSKEATPEPKPPSDNQSSPVVTRNYHLRTTESDHPGAQPSQGVTTYGLFRTKRASEENAGEKTGAPSVVDPVNNASKDSGLGGSLEAKEDPAKHITPRGAVNSATPPPTSSHDSRVEAPSAGDRREDDGMRDEVKPLPSQIHLPNDVDAKRLSIASETGIHDSGTIPEEKYSIPENLNVNWLPDGHFWVEIPGLPTDDISIPVFKAPEKVSFSTDPIRVFSTYSEHEYDRRNSDIDPISASAEYELERRLEKMEIKDVEIDKGTEGLGFSIIGMGVGADAGLEKLGIFVKSITVGGAVQKNGEIQVCDQIVEVDGTSLVGVTQAFAAAVLRSTQGSVRFRIGREKNLESSEIALLIRQSLQQDRLRSQQQQQMMQQMYPNGWMGGQGYETGESRDSMCSQDDSTTSATPVPTPSLEEESDSVFRKKSEDATPPDLLNESQPQIDNLMHQLRKSPPAPEEKLLPHTRFDREPSEEVWKAMDQTSERAFHTEPVGSSEAGPSLGTPLSGQMSQVLQESLVESAAKLRTSILGNGVAAGDVSSGNSSPASSRRSGVSSSIPQSSDEREIRAKIAMLEVELDEIKRQAQHYQAMLSESQSQCSEMEKKYVKAKKLLKDYQEREKDLLEREEVHLSQLRQKDQQYSVVVKQMKDKVSELDRQLHESHQKRTSLVEAQLSDLQNQLKQQVEKQSAMRHVTTTSTAEEPHSDISPALAYQPSRKTTQQPSTSTAFPKEDEEETWTPREPLSPSADPARDLSGLPVASVLDHTHAKSKADAVKQSQTMVGRQPPTKRPEIEVHDMCHHTEAHAHSLFTPCHHSAGGISSGSEKHEEADGGSTVSKNSSKNSPSHSSSTSATLNSTASPITPRKIIPTIFKSHAPHGKDMELTRDAEITHALDVLHWSCDDVCRFLKGLGLDKYIPEFTVNKVDGGKFLQLDGTRLKAMGVGNHTDRSLIKKRVKEVKSRIEKERKAIEKESRQMAKIEKRTTTKKR